MSVTKQRNAGVPAMHQGSRSPHLSVPFPGLILAVLLLTCLTLPAMAQVKDEKPETWVDENGTWRWTGSGKEVCAFGVNYTVPFAHAYRAHKYMEVSHEKAIGEDVYHFARLGFDAFRVHVWDCEISDTLGNLLENEHLRLFDYQVKLMKDRGIKLLITPIAYWGNGYPEPGEPTPGFSTKYGKANCLTDPGAILAQENYLSRFVNHVNNYTGLAYKDDPDILAFEICNEPHHGGSIKDTRTFINRMVAAIRQTGCTKPVFYNTSHSIRLAEAYYTSDIQGGTFQWYPSGLVAGHELKGNFLPNVAAYTIPFSDLPQFASKTRVVYEYDAADIGRSYIHPYMAKSFREAGFQFVTHFSYDPLHMAFANTEYQTHYMNLAFAPQKTLGLKIAGEVFRRLPLSKDYGIYPADTVFDVFSVSYHNDLAQMVSEEKYMYTNNTATWPPDPARLSQIAGYGISPVVSYEGCGAYFLDRLEKGVWRLEVMPDAIWVRDPFERASLKKEVSVICWKTWPMTVRLPDLGNNFAIRGLDRGNNHESRAEGGAFTISPGTYLLTAGGKKTKWKGDDPWNNILVGEFVAPETTCHRSYLLHQPLEETEQGKQVVIDAAVVTPGETGEVELLVYGLGWRPDRIRMTRTKGYNYRAVIPGDRVRSGILRYYITLRQGEVSLTWPGYVEGSPLDWDFYARSPYTTRVVDPSSPVLLFEAEKDGNKVYGNSRFMTLPSRNPGEQVLTISDRSRNREQSEIAARFCFIDKVRGRSLDSKIFTVIRVNAYCLAGTPCSLQVSLLMDDGTTFGKTISVEPGKDIYEIRLDELERTRTINLPNTFPGFLPFHSAGEFSRVFDLEAAESVQFSLQASPTEGEQGLPTGVAIEKVILK